MDVDRHQKCQSRNKMVASIPMRLTDLNVQCLNELFKYLEINDLVILARANLTNHKNLDRAFTAEVSSAAHPFESSIRNRFLQLGYADSITNNPDCIVFERTAFRYFSELIPTVRLYYDPNYQRHNAKIEQVIMKYGSALSEIELINADLSPFEGIQVPFLCVTKLKFEDGWFGQTFVELHKWFPNLKSLSLNCTKIADRRFTKQQHPNLVELSVKNTFCCCNDCNAAVAGNILDYLISNLHLKQFLAANPQLQCLTLFHDSEDGYFESDMQRNQFLIQINSDLLSSIAITLLRLSYLKLDIQEMFVLRIPAHCTKFSSLRTLVVEASQISQLKQLNIVCDCLNNLDITVHSYHQDCDVLSVFVSRFKYIESLSILHHPVTLDDDKFVEMIKSLANLKILRIALNRNSFSDDLFYIIKRFDRLHTLRICCIEIDPSNRKSFLDFVNENYFLKNNNWLGSCIFNEFEFKKC